MENLSATARVLHEEHMATGNLLSRVERALAAHQPDHPPAPGDGPFGRLLGDLIAALEGEIRRHFAFEEDRIFPILAAVGDGDIGDMLSEEHAEILPLATELTELARTARRDGFDPAAWNRFRRVGLSFAELLGAHIEKEENGLIPAVEAMLDPTADDELATDYAAAR